MSDTSNIVRLTLYICDESESSRRAIERLRDLCGDDLHDCELEVIDVLEHPDRAEEARILATPTLIKQLPPPVRRIIGDLIDRDQVLKSLQIHVRK
jgi:circadian clock protein KaiB